MIISTNSAIPTNAITSTPIHKHQAAALSENNPTPEVKKVNMNSISLNEINALIKSGVKGLLDIAPAVASEINSTYISEDEMNRKVDFIGQIEGQIEFKKSQQENTDFLEFVLSNIKKIHGMEMPPSVDTTA